VFPIEIPPLRERREDIPLLVNYFVSKLSKRMGKSITCIRDEVMQVLADNPWRGNIRELANFVERAVILTRGHELEIPPTALRSSAGTKAVSSSALTLQQTEYNVILSALHASSGRLGGSGGAAERLGMKRTTLQNKIRRLGIKKELSYT
jgi:formate hydrogenlyase transcriptional activator